MTAGYTLRFGDIDMSPSAQVNDVEYRVYGLRRGYPAPVTVAVNSMMQDGGLEHVISHENRDQSIVIGLRASDAEALARAESALFLEAQKVRNELAWTPTDGFGAETVFDVLWSSLEFADADDWDIEELLRCERVYTLTVRALPFGRSATATTFAALAVAGTPSTTSISDGTSTTGWTSPYSAVVLSSGWLASDCGPVLSVDSSGIETKPYRFDRALSSTDFSVSQYVSADFDVVLPDNHFALTAPSLFVNGVEAERLTAYPLTTASSRAVRVTWQVVGTAVTSLSFRGTTRGFFPTVGTPYPGQIKLDNVQRSNVPPSLTSTGRETLRVVEVGGSARTPVSLKVASSSALGRVALYTAPALRVGGYQPALSSYRTTPGPGTADTATLSGARKSGSVSTDLPTFEIPASRLPEGGYLLFLRARSTAGSVDATFTWTASTIVGSTALGTQTGTSAPVALGSGANGWQLVPVGGMVLPPTNVSEQSVATVRVSIAAAGGTEWDEAMLFWMGDDAALTIVDAGTGSVAWGTGHSGLWIEAPTLEYPAPRVLLSADGSRETAFHAGEKAQAWGVHQFRPGDTTIYVATTNAANPDVSGSCFLRFHTHASRVG